MLKVVTHVEDGLGTVAKTIVAQTEEDWKLLQIVFQRATNLWPDAPPNVKAIADVVTNGKVMQDYESQNTDQRQRS
jgi:hypothetical protein